MYKRGFKLKKVLILYFIYNLQVIFFFVLVVLIFLLFFLQDSKNNVYLCKKFEYQKLIKMRKLEESIQCVDMFSKKII